VIFASNPFKLVIFLLPLLVISGDTFGQAGAVSSNVTQPAASAPATTTDTKPLPWKFLTAPMGVLPAALGADVDSLSSCSDPRQAIPSAKVEELLTATIGNDAVKQLKTQRSRYVVIHVVDPTSGPKASDAWYLYRSAKGNWGDPKWDCEKFTGQRIYGASSVLFLFLHLHAKAVSLDDARQQLTSALTASRSKSDTLLTKGLLQASSSSLSDTALNAALKTNALDTGLKAPDLQTVTFCEKDSGDHFQWLRNDGVPTTYANVHYEAAVVKRTPANVENLKTILGLLFGAHSKDNSCLDITTTDATIWGAGRIQNVGLPSDVSIAGYSQGADSPLKEEDRSGKQIGAVGAYNNEPLYWWDASIGIPIHKIKDLQYSDTDNTVVATQVDRQSAYAMFNLMLHPVDLSEPRYNIWPRVLVGFPLASSPWDKLFAGGAIGLPWKPFQNFQFFAGATFLRDASPATLDAGSSASNAQLLNDLRLKTTPKFTFGINVPVKSVIDRLR
jgi:hypothetical protein